MASKSKGLGKKKSSLITFIVLLIIVIAYNLYDKAAAPNKSGELLEVHIIDIGQGDSALIRHKDSTVLIDAGPRKSGAFLKEYLKSLGVDRLDYAILTHPHEDHIGGAAAVLDRFEVGKLLLTDLEATTYTFEELLDSIERNKTYAEIPALGDEYEIGDIKFKILAPITPTDDSNNMSLVIKFTFGDTDFLFTGDAEKDVEAEMLKLYPKESLDCDLLKVGHHGSNTSSTAEFLAAVSPKIATISCGYDNDYGHPHGEVLARLKKCGTEKILITKDEESFVVYSDGEDIFHKDKISIPY